MKKHRLPLVGIACTLMFATCLPGTGSAMASLQTVAASSAPSQPGLPYTADQLHTLLPPSVYFQGKVAPLQARNAGGTSFGPNAAVWAALVDTSGYASAIQERYQFYLVTESRLQVGDKTVPAGAYGGGFLGDRFVLMDPGGHTVAEGATQTDAALPRPRPLQILPDGANAVKLFLGRRWVRLQAAGQ